MKFWNFASLAAVMSISIFAAEPKLVHVSSMPLSKFVLHPDPEYPQDALAMKVQGAVKVSVIIGEDGHVLDAKAVSGNRLLGPAAAQAVRGWTFEPTTEQGHAVKVVTSVTVTFALDREGKPVRSRPDHPGLGEARH